MAKSPIKPKSAPAKAPMPFGKGKAPSKKGC
jgi:hypothetical protein